MVILHATKSIIFAGDFLLLPRSEHGRSMREIYDAWYLEAIKPHPARITAFEQVLEIAARTNSMPTGLSLFLRQAHGEAKKLMEARRASESGTRLSASSSVFWARKR